MKKLILLFLLIFVSRALVAQKNELGVGDKAPLFKAVDQNGKTQILAELFPIYKVVVVFYRGHWCPFCTKELRNIQDSLDLFRAKKAKVIAISPEKQEYIEKTIDNTDARFSILHDQNMEICDAYNVSFLLDETAQLRMKKVGIDLKATNGGDGNKLPIPAVYIIGNDGRISYLFYDPNYRNRPSVKELLEHL